MREPTSTFTLEVTRNAPNVCLANMSWMALSYLAVSPGWMVSVNDTGVGLAWRSSR